MAETPLISTIWRLDSAEGQLADRRGIAAATEDKHLSSMVGEGFEVTHRFHATSPQRRGMEALPPLDVTIPVEPGALYVLAVRHDGSDALSFHALNPPAVRRGAKFAPTTATFKVVFTDAPVQTTRGLDFTQLNPIKAVTGVVLKAVGRLADITVPWIGSKVEKLIWKKKGLSQGWLQITPDGLKNGNLPPADFSLIGNPADRCLLLLHGTFSNVAGAFGGLVTTRSAGGQDFFSAVQSLYGNRIYAFNHFTVSKTPQENAQDLINGLPLQGTFDVITHSRGGLVLRNLVERSSVLGPNARNFQLGRAVLVASPTQGTPLATADRFDQLISWWSNLLELFPENPYGTIADYIGDALNFIARHVVDALPGVDSMNANGGQISELQLPPGPPPGAYSVLVSNYQPKGNLLARVLDLGIDAIFGMANDLVVPSEGSWKVDQRNTWVAGTQIGCFGNNMISAGGKDVIHTTYFAQPETTDFLIKTLKGQPLEIAAIDPDIHLPFFLRRSLSVSFSVAAPVGTPHRTSRLHPMRRGRGKAW